MWNRRNCSGALLLEIINAAKLMINSKSIIEGKWGLIKALQHGENADERKQYVYIKFLGR